MGAVVVNGVVRMDGDLVQKYERVAEERDRLAEEIEYLAGFLMEHYPHEITRGGPDNGESVVDVAIRLLDPWEGDT